MSISHIDRVPISHVDRSSYLANRINIQSIRLNQITLFSLDCETTMLAKQPFSRSLVKTPRSLTLEEFLFFHQPFFDTLYIRSHMILHFLYPFTSISHNLTKSYHAIDNSPIAQNPSGYFITSCST